MYSLINLGWPPPNWLDQDTGTRVAAACYPKPPDLKSGGQAVSNYSPKKGIYSHYHHRCGP